MMSRFGGVTLKEASSAWHSKEDYSNNSSNTLNQNSTATLDTTVQTSTHEAGNAFGNCLGVSYFLYIPLRSY